jgi:eukaryotic-like serine/threonine-protein kinase
LYDDLWHNNLQWTARKRRAIPRKDWVVTDRIGQQLGNYRLIRLLGKGGFAEVYLGEHVYLKTPAAIKILQTKVTNQEDLDGFLKEAQTVAQLFHPHIVRILEFGLDGETPFLVMDYAPNGTLRERHPRGAQLPLPTIILYVKQIAEALQYAHEEKFIHRDVKPENMLVGRRDTLLLSDFGIALIVQSSRYQSTQEVIGTVAYMSPEQIQGKPRPASDQYSLGIVVYEWLSGDRPFHGSFTELCTQHMFAAPPPLHEKILAHSPEVEQVVMTALAKDPKHRFATVQAFANALVQASQVEASGTNPVSQSPQSTDAITSLSETQQPTVPATPFSQPSIPTELVTLQGEPLSSSNPSTVRPDMMRPTGQPQQQPLVAERSQGELEPLQRGISRRTVVLVLGGLAIAGIASGITWLALSHPPLGAVTPPTSTPVPTSTPTSTPMPTPTPPTPGTTLFIYRGHSNGVFAVAWSPDSRRIASASLDHTARVWDASTGENVLTYRGHSSSVDAVAWSPDSGRIASASGDRTVQVWDASTGGNVLTYRGHSIEVHSVAWSPDGGRIASASFDYTARVWDASTGENVLTYRGHSNAVFAAAWSPDGKRIASASLDRTVQVWQAS